MRTNHMFTIYDQLHTKPYRFGDLMNIFFFPLLDKVLIRNNVEPQTVRRFLEKKRKEGSSDQKYKISLETRTLSIERSHSRLEPFSRRGGNYQKTTVGYEGMSASVALTPEMSFLESSTHSQLPPDTF
ncbi:hypothetical protein CEXT_77371 [Caerostris extrusa]|uniref:Transposase n=1 Tax=Caerostris extrusa TaxID=172846 RepID=A0AAV4UB12_CAEEX|nr:hypothetical protein CEXT_77371 [Caerostris extrusa]